jgi:NADH dehydrogenase [ubiquinone] 1 alpha subcomplex assembly factor 1
VSHPDTTWLPFDFSDRGAVAEWNAIDDRVMGGVSSIRLRRGLAGHAPLEGNVSLERNGGFASIWSTPTDRGKPGAQSCFIEARAPGQRYNLNLLVDDAFDSINCQASFAPEATSHTLHVPLASYRGRGIPARTDG